MNNKIIILIGKSASGKDTLARLIEENLGFNFIVSTTTRPMRPGESNRNPYNFVNNEHFENLIKQNELIEYREYNTLVDNIPEKWYYGVENHEVDNSKKYVVVLDTVGLREFKEHFSDRVISIFLDVDDHTRKLRCVQRGDFNETEWHRRLEDDKIRFSPEIIENEIQYVINSNKSSSEMLNEVIQILNNN